eukprot:TRINITY_DN2957_c0_g1_i1.p1 TRINITY_DN2957_c0_g1~~TRINITY_DN2957_c0_g1_i1.p1  ORF type:complete len:274 (+),score=4.40 TRINITY_DN2957_c0_g1_i1:102-923(+)
MQSVNCRCNYSSARVFRTQTRKKTYYICCSKSGVQIDETFQQINSKKTSQKETYLRHLEKMWQLSTTTLPAQIQPPLEQVQKTKRDEFYVNLGYAVRTLREEIPLLFYKELTYDIYREDIVFRDPRNSFRGIDNYKIIFGSLRLYGQIIFSSVVVDVRRIWQLSDDTLKMQWTVRGVPRIPWKMEGRFDGYSIYKLDRHGKIYEHQVDNVIFYDPPFQRIPLFANLQFWQQYVPQRSPCPGIQCIQTLPFSIYLWIMSLLVIGYWDLGTSLSQ